jgi:hypothetical protein
MTRIAKGSGLGLLHFEEQSIQLQSDAPRGAIAAMKTLQTAKLLPSSHRPAVNAT